MTVTFDTNTLSDVVSPETSQRTNGQENGTYVREAIQSGHVRGFFCETLVTLEGIQNIDRVDVLGSTRIESEFSSPDKNTINITLAVKQDRKPLPAKFRERIQTAQGLGIRALRGPARIGWIRIEDEDGKLFQPYEPAAKLVEQMDKVNELATAIAARGLGHAVPVKLGLELTARDGITQPELWLQGLRRAKESERKKIQRAIAEWADGDSVASHYGHGIDLFCTEDFGRNASGPSILDNNNRAWLSKDYGIKFVTLAELTAMLI